MKASKFTVLLLFLLVAGCAHNRSSPPPRMADSAATARSVQQLAHKKFLDFRGPADILGGATKNERNPPMTRTR